jgi:hypothetical protein
MKVQFLAQSLQAQIDLVHFALLEQALESLSKALPTSIGVSSNFQLIQNSKKLLGHC